MKIRKFELFLPKIRGFVNRIGYSAYTRLKYLWHKITRKKSKEKKRQQQRKFKDQIEEIRGRMAHIGARLDDVVHKQAHIGARLDDVVHKQAHIGARLDDVVHKQSHIIAQLHDAALAQNYNNILTSYDVGWDTSFAVANSFRRLSTVKHKSEHRIGVVSVLPPMETGIATYTLRTFEASPAPVDIFAPFPDAGAYLAAVHRLSCPDSPVEIYDLQAFSLALARRNYDAVVWVIGSSLHHLPVLRLLRDTRHLESLAPNLIQIHDLLLFNLAQHYANSVGVNLATMLKLALTMPIKGVDWAEIAKGDIGTIVNHPGLAARALFQDLPLHGIILHSRAARDLLLRDWPDMGRLDQRLLYLPVIEPFTVNARSLHQRDELRIGSFGIPATSKGTDQVIAAFRLLRQQRPKATLVLAGYNVAKYVQAEGLANESGLEVHDSPNDSNLFSLMSSVDVAVQLRTHNTGESSGIVPQLLSRDVPIITSAIGAFAEYGDAVIALPAALSSEDLCKTILAEVEAPSRRRTARRNYVETHGPADFCMELLRQVVADKVIKLN